MNRSSLNILTYGMGYLGIAYSAWLANIGHVVTAYDKELDVSKIKLEPKLELELEIATSCSDLKLTNQVSDINHYDVVMVTYDTPIDSNGNADVQFIIDKVSNILPFIVDQSTLIVICSQIPVGTIKKLETQHTGYKFAYIPENVRVGKSIEYLQNIDRIILGSRNHKDVELIDRIVNIQTSFSKTPIIWMSPESAEMTKHTINAFLATNISFINEIAKICKIVGANSDDVTAGIKSEWRIGKNLPLMAGKPFNSGHLERDLKYLEEIANNGKLDKAVLRAATITNNREKGIKSNSVNFYGKCELCGYSLRGVDKSHLECSNTNCKNRYI